MNDAPLVDQRHFAYHQVSAFFICMLSLASCGCFEKSGQDSWKHYTSGGMFHTKWVAVSADGQYLAYASACTGNGDIYLLRSGASQPARLTDSDAFESSPLFAPDDNQIVFVREEGQRSHIWMMRSDGTNKMPLTQGNFIHDLLQVSQNGRFLLFSRARPSRGLGLSSRCFLMRLDQPAADPIPVGDLAVLSGGSDSVVYWESGELWRMYLENPRGTRRKIVGTGQPTDLSADGRMLLTVGLPEGAPWTLEQEIWLLDLQNDQQQRLGTGHSAVFFGPADERVLFFVGYDQTPYVVASNGGTPVRVECPNTRKTAARVCPRLGGAVFGASLRPGIADYDVMFIDFQNMRARTIASLGCSDAWFQSPVEDHDKESRVEAPSDAH